MQQIKRNSPVNIIKGSPTDNIYRAVFILKTVLWRECVI